MCFGQSFFQMDAVAVDGGDTVRTFGDILHPQLRFGPPYKGNGLRNGRGEAEVGRGGVQLQIYKK